MTCGMGKAVIARRYAFASAVALCAAIVMLASLAAGPSDKAPIARDNTYFFSELVARAGDLVTARGADSRALTQRATLDHDAKVARVAAPAIAVPGSEIWVEARLTNTGLATWTAGGERPVRLSYHWLDEHGRTLEWDGARTGLTSDVPPGRTVTAIARVRVPSVEGTYILAWDMVQDGTGWFSTNISSANTDVVVVQSDGVTFYGKGWGHGSGLSQWGAQGWAQGAAGVKKNGEEIALHYFPGATLGTQPPSKPFRVLLSAPSTGCVERTIYTNARMWSAGGMRLVNDLDPSVVYAEAGPHEALNFTNAGGAVVVRFDGSPSYVYLGDTPVTLVPTQWWDPITIQQKGLSYRGNIQVQPGPGYQLNVVNYVSSDDYMQGVLPSEMPAHWEFEALRAQAITARTYAAWRQSGAQGRTWDVLDDIKDQCYGGRSHEDPRSTQAVQATKAQILVHAGKPIRALFSSAHGGVSENVGCMLSVEKVAGRWTCAPDWPYMNAVQDPAELAAYDRRGGMPHSWARSFSAATIRHEIIVDYGIDIGQFVAMQFAYSPGGRPLSVKVVGSLGVADLPGDKFIRTTLGMKSSLVRPFPF
ncbi:MAG TPA: SpoIID/LytB domain-containing protein [Candidatus Limnocylindria bacterium]|nr:SpoIID/LytB domain-containing protein [Candidatus Limnocylindria bacterium]